MADNRGESKELAVSVSTPVEKSPQTSIHMSKDEHRLAQLGYKQVFIRSFGMFENWAATFTTMNYVSGIPVLFGFAMYSGGPQSAFANWTMVGGCSFIVSLSMAEIAASLPTAGGIYYWAYRLGGEKHGALLSWLTAWYNWAGWVCIIPGLSQGNTNFLVSALEIQYPNSAVVRAGWFTWCLSAAAVLLSLIPNCVNQTTVRWMLRATAYSTVLLLSFYWIWFPIAATKRGGFQPGSILTTFYNGINLGVDAEGNTIKQASDSYCWLIGVLYGAWVFYGYDASVHLAEETHEASTIVARGMWTGTFVSWVASVPTLIIILFCMQDFTAIVNGGYANNWAEYLVQLVGPTGATAILVLTWADGLLCTGVCVLSAQRITYAIARDGTLPFSRIFNKLSPKHHLPVNAALLIGVLAIAINAAVIGSTVAFSAITAAATISTNVSYIIPVIARHTSGKKTFQTAKWNLGRWSVPIAIFAIFYVSFLFVVLILPQLFPVDAETFNYAPVMIGGITIIALGGWVMPFGLGGRYWFTGPKRTISEADVLAARVVGEDDA